MNSDFLSDSDVLYLKGLFNSAKLYLEDTSGNVVACNNTDTSYILNKVVNGIGNKTYSLSITIEPAHNNYAQQL
jgi:hypothetical protein